MKTTTNLSLVSCLTRTKGTQTEHNSLVKWPLPPGRRPCRRKRFFARPPGHQFDSGSSSRPLFAFHISSEKPCKLGMSSDRKHSRAGKTLLVQLPIEIAIAFNCELMILRSWRQSRLLEFECAFQRMAPHFELDRTQFRCVGAESATLGSSWRQMTIGLLGAVTVIYDGRLALSPSPVQFHCRRLDSAHEKLDATSRAN